MKLFVYTRDLKSLYEIGFPIAVQTQRFYNGIGKFQIVLNASEYNAKIIQKNRFIRDIDTGEFYTIQSIKYEADKNLITASGYTANWMLNLGYVNFPYDIHNVETDVLTVVRETLGGLSKILAGEPTGISKVFDTLIYKKPVLDCCIDILDHVGLGNRMVLFQDGVGNKFLEWQIYEGKDLTPATAGSHAVVFSENQGTARGLVFIDDDSTWKNYVEAEGTDNIGNPVIAHWDEWDRNLDLRKYYFKSPLIQGDEETKEAFKKRLVKSCQEEAYKRKQRRSFKVELDGSELGTRYNLGDKITCVSEKLGITFETRITGATFKMDIHGAKTKLLLGEPAISALEEVALKQ